MKRFMKSAMAVALAFTLALGVSVIPAKAAGTKGLVAPFTIPEKGQWGSTNITSWFGPDAYTTDFSKYSVSADVYIPKAAIPADTCLNVSSWINFWFQDTNTNGMLPNERKNEVLVGYDSKGKTYWANGFDEEKQEDVETPFASVTEVGDMVKLEIVNAPVMSKLYSTDWDEAANFQKPWEGAIPEKNGHINASVRVGGGDAKFDGKFAVSNVSVKVGDKVLTSNYDSDEDIGDAWGDVQGEIGTLKASTFNTTALSVAKASVNVKAKKSASVKVTTMFAGDKVKVSTSSKKVATASYKNGKVTIKGVKKGKATVSVKANGKTKKIKVTVK